MDFVWSIWLSSVTSAVLFFSAGRLGGKALFQRTIEPSTCGDRAARLQSEAEIEELSETVRWQRVEAIRLQACLDQLQVELDIARLRAEDVARLEVENGVLRREIEDRRRGREDVAFAGRAAAPEEAFDDLR